MFHLVLGHLGLWNNVKSPGEGKFLAFFPSWINHLIDSRGIWIWQWAGRMVLLQISFRRKQKLVAKMKYYLSAICFIPEEDVQYDSLSNHCLLRVIMTSEESTQVKKLQNIVLKLHVKSWKKASPLYTMQKKNSLIHQKCQQHKAENWDKGWLCSVVTKNTLRFLRRL